MQAYFWYPEKRFPLSFFNDETPAFTPTCDVHETETHYVLDFDVPGINKDDIKIEVHENRLFVSGERKIARDVERTNLHFSERAAGKFERTFTLPSTVDTARIEAAYENGVLQVTIPKAETAKPRQIKVA